MTDHLRMFLRLLACTLILLQSSSPKSVDRINFGVHFQYLGSAYISTATYVYDYLIKLPNSSISFEPKHLPICNAGNYFNQLLLNAFKKTYAYRSNNF